MDWKNNIICIWGDHGKAWLASLPERVATLIHIWDLCSVEPMLHLSYNYVLTGIRRSDGLPVVLKLSYDMTELTNEIATLQAYGGIGCVALVERNLDIGAVLLERVIPGTSLASLFPHDDTLAMEHTLRIMHCLHAASLPGNAITGFATVIDWLQTLYLNTKLSGYHIQKAQDLARDLTKTAAPNVLLHGDLHHDNILASIRDGWLAIDPKGVLGEPLYEVGAFVRNPIPYLLEQPNVSYIIAHRLDYFSAALGTDKQRLQAWCYVQAILAACWAAQENRDPAPWLAQAKIIDKL